MNNKQSFHWVLDAALLAGFLALFFLELTGVELHQWLGIGVGTLSGVHLITHWNWVKSVTAKFFRGAGARARDYYLIDAALLLGFSMILLTGLVISTWLDLGLASYVTWVDLHVAASVGTLLVLVLKIALHGRWIITTAQRMFGRVPSAARLPYNPQPVQGGMPRRAFIGLMGIVGMSTWVAISSVLSDNPKVQAEALPEGQGSNSSNNGPASVTVGQASANSAQTSAQGLPLSVQPSSVLSSGNSSQAATPTVRPTAAAASPATTCRVQCSKKCSFPGKCRKYVDRNNNKKCDLGECL